MSSSLNKDTYFWDIWNDDYNSFISHIATNQHRLSSYAENLSVYYDKIDEINSQLQSDLINEIKDFPSPKNHEYDESPDKSFWEDSVLDNRIENLNKLVNNILYGGRKSKAEGKFCTLPIRNIEINKGGIFKY